MIVEERVYTVQMGKLNAFLAYYAENGMAAQLRYLGRMYGYFYTEVGKLNQVTHLWAYRDLAERDARRARLDTDPAWLAYRSKAGDYLVDQTTRILKPAPFFAERLEAMCPDTATDGAATR
jgi:hypothetical protein